MINAFTRSVGVISPGYWQKVIIDCYLHVHVITSNPFEGSHLKLIAFIFDRLHSFNRHKDKNEIIDFNFLQVFDLTSRNQYSLSHLNRTSIFFKDHTKMNYYLALFLKIQYQIKFPNISIPYQVIKTSNKNLISVMQQTFSKSSPASISSPFM